MPDDVTAVDLIIPTLNGSDLLRECLLHLAASTFSDYQVLIYDDGSTEDIAGLVGAVMPTARIVRSPTNRGLAHGFNRCIKATSSEYIVVLNNDVEVSTHWLAELVACAERHPDAGSIASKLRLHDRRDMLHSAGDTYSCRGVAGNRGVWLPDLGQYDHETEVFGACGGAALYRRTALSAVALVNGQIFDERLFMYYEDVDVGWRLQCAGFPCVFAPEAIVYHRLSATGGGSLASYYVARNALWVLRHTVPAEVRAANRQRMFAHHLGRVVRTLPHLREPAARATLRGTIDGLRKRQDGGVPSVPLSALARNRLEALLRHQRQPVSRECEIARLPRWPAERCQQQERPTAPGGPATG